jgi:predicted anti-sigma-YlaC factor YlaD
MTLRRAGSHPDDLISASLTGELTVEERVELDQHLATCESCRETLAAFADERRLVSGLRLVPAPRDLSARVRRGIEAGRFASIPWWRRPGGVVAIGASLATVAAAVLAVAVISNLNHGPVGQTSSPGPSSSELPSASLPPSTAPSVRPSLEPALALGSGELGYLSLNGAPLEALRLTFVNDATGKSISAGTVSGPPIAAALSPNGEWLGYITRKGETGANEVWALHLTDGKVVPLGCSVAAPFTERLAWDANGSVLGYTLTSVDLGAGSGCPVNDAKLGTTEPWLWQAGRNKPPSRATRAGADSFAADFSGEFVTLVESHAAATPTTIVACQMCDSPPEQTIDGVFLPLLSPDGNRALFWTGTMASGAGGWQFSRGGMPQLSGDFRSAGPASPWLGIPLFTDLMPVGGEAFASGKFTWGPDSDLIAFWDGAWTGAPQSADGTYPNRQDVYVGRVSAGLLSSASRLPLTLDPGAWIVDVTFSPDGSLVCVTIGVPSAGIGDPPSAYLQIVPLAGGAPRTIGGGVSPPAWNGPAVFGP